MEARLFFTHEPNHNLSTLTAASTQGTPAMYAHMTLGDQETEIASLLAEVDKNEQLGVRASPTTICTHYVNCYCRPSTKVVPLMYGVPRVPRRSEFPGDNLSENTQQARLNTEMPS